MSDVGHADFLVLVLMPTVIWLLLYPFVGKFVESVASYLLDEIVTEYTGKSIDYDLTDRDFKILAAGFWLIIMFVIPFQLVALLVAKLYRAAY